MPIKKRREKEAEKIHRANRAAAVGRLMLGEISSWADFISVDTIDYANLPRKQLKSGVEDIKKRLSSEIVKFCERNFEDMDIDILSRLFEDIKAKRGLEITCDQFAKKNTLNFKVMCLMVCRPTPPSYFV